MPVLPYPEIAAILTARPPRGAVRIVAVDGGSGSGKSTVAAGLAAALDGVVVHTDEVAWWESFFDWWPLLRSGVLEPVAAGAAVAYRPPAWDRRGRPGAITVPAGTALVVEGVGASRRELADLLDTCVWVHCDPAVARRRGLARDRLDSEHAAEAERFWDEWMAEESAHLAVDQPWLRATVVVDTSGEASHDPARAAVVTRPAAVPAQRP